MQELQHSAGRFFDAECIGVDDELGLFGCLVGRVDAGVVFNFSGASFFVQPLYVKRLTGLKRGFAVDFKEVTMRHEIAHGFAVVAERADKRRHGNDAGFHHQLGSLANTADVFPTVVFGKAEVG